MAAALAAGLFSLMPNTAMAATIQVGVDGCTLGNAITNANADSDADGAGGCAMGNGADTITLPANSVQTLLSALPEISSKITIEGKGGRVRRDPDAPAFRIFTVTDTGNLTLNETSVSGGVATGADIADKFGGGILNYGVVALSRSIVSGNFAATIGGGMFNRGTATLNHSSIANNRAQLGGGLSNVTGVMTVRHSVVLLNTANVLGGGVWTFLGSTQLTNSTVSGNRAGNVGGGLAGVAATVTLTDTTVSGNTAVDGGGGIYQYYGDTTLERSLISGNSGSGNPGPEVIFEDGNGNEGTITVDNYNLFGFDGDAGISGFAVGPTDIVPNGPLAAILEPLAGNGLPSQTHHALVEGSPAIDAASSECSVTDQRGVTRPQGAACDIGAFELESDAVASLTLVPASATRLTLETQCLTVTAENAVGDGVADVDIDFTRSGANPGTQTVETDDDGQAQHCWTGVNGGVDRVTATFEELASNESVITWNKRVTSIQPEAVVGIFVLGQNLIRIAPRAKLSDVASDDPIAGRTVQFTAGSAALCEAVTNASGVATCSASVSGTLKALLTLGYTAKFPGDSTYKPVQKKGPPVKIKLGS